MALYIGEDCINFIEIRGFPYYFAGSDGNIYSGRGQGKGVNSYNNPKRKMKGSIGRRGCIVVNLKNPKVSRRSCKVSILIAESFLGLPPDDNILIHKNGNIHDNRISNLSYIHYKNYKDNENIGVDTWKDITGYEGLYKVSDTGKVRSISRYVKAGTSLTFVEGGELVLYKNNLGYTTVGLSKGGITKTQSVHRLVIRAFIPPTDVIRTHVNHIDSDPSNNNINNLEWCTPSENLLHGYQYGNISRKGDRHNNRKISQDDAESIRELNTNTNMSQKEIGKRFGITQPMVSLIINNKNWDNGVVHR